MAVYTTRERLERQFGKTNISRWADLENNGLASEIAAQIAWAIEEVSRQIDDEMRGGPYEVPFADIADAPPTPSGIVTWCTQKCGLLLYDSRGHTDGTDGFASLRKQVAMTAKAMRVLRKRLDIAEIASYHPAKLDPADDAEPLSSNPLAG